jgi:hypothetical protein
MQQTYNPSYFLYYALQPFCWALASFSVFLILCPVCRTAWTGDQPVARPLPTHRTTKHTINTNIHTSVNPIGCKQPSFRSIPPMGFKPTISVSVTVIGTNIRQPRKILEVLKKAEWKWEVHDCDRWLMFFFYSNIY